MGWYLVKNQIQFRISGINAVYVSFALIFISASVLVRELIQSNFQLEYISNYSSATTPLIYKITGLWAGMEGSLLFWLLILSMYSIIVITLHRKRFIVLMPWVIIILLVIQCFFIIMCNFIEDPFLPAVNPSNRSSGLNPLLQHPLMVIHPPLLYLGFIGFSVPFAFALAALITNSLDAEWIRATRRWTLFPWGCLSIAIVLGGKWAYMELGWGGYWAWDPVENASLFPWITGTAYLHSVLIQEKKNMLKRWNMILIMLTFTLTIFGTYLTRSGIISSIHAFAATDLGIWFFGFIIYIVLFNIFLLWKKRHVLVSQNRLESLVSRESGFLFNNVVFVSMCAAILWGTLYPLLSEAITGVQITIGSTYFNHVIIPFGIVLLILTGIGPLLAWRKTSVKSVKKNFTIPIISGFILTAIWAIIFKVKLIYPLIFSVLVIFVCAVIFMEFYRAVSTRVRLHNEDVFSAFAILIKKNRSRYGGYIVHLGIMMMFAGFIGKAFDKEADLSMKLHEIVTLKNYSLEYRKFWAETPETDPEKRSNHIAKIIAIEVKKDGEQFAFLQPEKRFYVDQNNQPHSEVAIRSTLFEDLYMVLGDVDMDTGQATLKVKINPMVTWVWLGTLMLTIGVIICINPKLPRLKY